MRILIVCQYYYPEKVTITPIAEDLVKRGHDVTVVTGRPNYGLNDIPKAYRHLSYEERNGVKIHRVWLYPRKKGKLSLILNYLSFNFSSRRFLSRLKEQYDVVYSMSMSPVMSVQGAGSFAKKHHIPHALHCLDLWPESAVVAGNVNPEHLLYRILYRWSRKIYLGADEILISSPSFKDYFVSTLRMPASNISYLPQPPLIEADDGPREAKAVELPSGFNLVYAGNVGKLQLIEEMIEAIKKLPNDSAFHFHVIGTGVNLEASEKKAKELGVQDKVIFHGPKSVAEVASYYEEADMILVSLRSGASPVYKTIPNKLITSLACGKPIFGLIAGDGRELLEQIGGSLIVDEIRDRIVIGLQKAMTLTKEQKEAMGKANREAFIDRFSFEKVMDQLEAAIVSSKK